MYSEKTTIVDVIGDSDNGYFLSMVSDDLYEAAQNGDVLRRHDVGTAAAPEYKYVRLSGVKLSNNTYTFTFESGDMFEGAPNNRNDYPESDSISDTVGSGSSGVLVVHDVDGTLDKTWQEINESSVPIMIQAGDEWRFVASVRYDEYDGGYIVEAIFSGGITVSSVRYVSASASDYPTVDLSGGGTAAV